MESERSGPRRPRTTPIVDGVRDYSTGKGKAVEVVVRPRYRYGEAGPGEHVKVDEREMRILSSAETLCTPKEYKRLVGEAKAARKEAAKPEPKPVDAMRSAIASQLEAATKAARTRRQGDRRFVQQEGSNE